MEELEGILKGLKFTEIKFPCGLEICTTKEILKDYKKITCPLHGKKCENKSTRLIKELKK